jgi:hypothetical protein
MEDSMVHEELPKIPLALNSIDLGQTLDALDGRGLAYERTAQYLDGELDDGAFAEDPFIIEEVTDADEARGIAAHFRAVEKELNRQWDAWKKNAEG